MIIINNNFLSGPGCILRIGCILAMAFTGFSSTLQAQEYEDVLEDVLESFGQKDYDTIIMLLTDYPPDQLSGNSQKLMAYELLSVAYFLTAQGDSAKSVLNTLIELKPDYTPQPPQYTEAFIELVEEVKNEYRQRRSGSLLRKKWFWISGVVLASSVTLYFVLRKGDPVELPFPPDPPDFH